MSWPTDTVLVQAQNVHEYWMNHYKEHGWEDPRKFVCCRLPFPAMAIAFDTKLSAGPNAPGHLRHMGVIFYEKSPSEVIERYLNRPKKTPEHDEVIRQFRELNAYKAIEMHLSADGDLAPGSALCFIDEKGLALSQWFYLLTTSEHDNLPIPASQMVFTVKTLGCIGLATVNFMNCRNVEIVDNPPTRQQRRAAERDGEPAPVTYKTLHILPFTTKRRVAGSANLGPSGEISLHIVRGHFKDYRQGKGLGRRHMKGVYWWQPQVRGSEKAGRVVKDYAVEASR